MRKVNMSDMVHVDDVDDDRAVTSQQYMARPDGDWMLNVVSSVQRNENRSNYANDSADSNSVATIGNLMTPKNSSKIDHDNSRAFMVETSNVLDG